MIKVDQEPRTSSRSGRSAPASRASSTPTAVAPTTPEVHRGGASRDAGARRNVWRRRSKDGVHGYGGRPEYVAALGRIVVALMIEKRGAVDASMRSLRSGCRPDPVRPVDYSLSIGRVGEARGRRRSPVDRHVSSAASQPAFRPRRSRSPGRGRVLPRAWREALRDRRRDRGSLRLVVDNGRRPARDRGAQIDRGRSAEARPCRVRGLRSRPVGRVLAFLLERRAAARKTWDVSTSPASRATAVKLEAAFFDLPGGLTLELIAVSRTRRLGRRHGDLQRRQRAPLARHRLTCTRIRAACGRADSAAPRRCGSTRGPVRRRLCGSGPRSRRDHDRARTAPAGRRRESLTPARAPLAPHRTRRASRMSRRWRASTASSSERERPPTSPARLGARRGGGRARRGSRDARTPMSGPGARDPRPPADAGEDPFNAFIRRCRVEGAPAGRSAGLTVGVKDNIALGGRADDEGSRFPPFTPSPTPSSSSASSTPAATIVGHAQHGRLRRRGHRRDERVRAGPQPGRPGAVGGRLVRRARAPRCAPARSISRSGSTRAGAAASPPRSAASSRQGHARARPVLRGRAHRPHDRLRDADRAHRARRGAPAGGDRRRRLARPAVGPRRDPRRPPTRRPRRPASTACASA